MRRNDRRRNGSDEIDCGFAILPPRQAQTAVLFVILSERAHPPPRLIRRYRQALSAAPIEIFERGKHRHTRARAVGEFAHESWADAILGLGASEVFRSSRFDDAIALGADDRERVDERRSLVEIGAQHFPPYARRALDLDNPLGWNALPLRDSRRTEAEHACQFGHIARCFA